MLDLKDAASASPDHDEDFVGWLDAQAAVLRTGRLALLDRENLIDELTSMANRHRHKAQSRLEVVLTHLLKYQFQPDHRTRSWQATLLEQRRFPPPLVQALQARGHEVREQDMTSGLQAIQRTPGGFFGGADPRREGIVMGD